METSKGDPARAKQKMISTELRSSRKQEWAVGETVKVGFLHLRVLAGPIPTPGNYHADEWALESLNGAKFYRFTPHAGCFRCQSRDEAINGSANY